MGRVHAQTDLVVLCRIGPAARHEFRVGRFHSGTATPDEVGENLVARTLDTGERAACPLQPVVIALRRIGRIRVGQTESLQVDERGNTFGTGTGIQAGDIAAHAVADEAHWGIRAVVLQQVIEVGQVIGEPECLGRDIGRTKATPVRRHDKPVARQLVDDELKRRSTIAETMQVDEQRVARITPLIDRVVDAADRHAARYPLARRFVFMVGSHRNA